MPYTQAAASQNLGQKGTALTWPHLMRVIVTLMFQQSTIKLFRKTYTKNGTKVHTKNELPQLKQKMQLDDGNEPTL